MTAAATPSSPAPAGASPGRLVWTRLVRHRLALTGMYSRLAASLQALTGTEALRHALPPSDPYPDAESFLADLRVIEGIVEALKTGRRVDLPPFERRRRINTATQKQTLSPITPPETVKAK